ncbi:NAD(P)-dependent oxidoreductase [Nocardia wallacei]|uniref:NAD(P)-dependent oxidoreductase n=1 Tax=Nocardia wallacei TaxID=480035 RepID=UPI00245840C9|nr:NAD(P)H-binding protein [Nocardia wallacei]
MRIAVAGANGRTGTHVVIQALARGHEVTALARRPDTVTHYDPQLRVTAADVLERESLAGPLTGVDAVVSALGIATSRQPTVVYSQGIANILDVMHDNGICVLSAISAIPAAPRGDQPSLQRHIVMPILDRFFGATYDDMRRMESALAKSEVDWVTLRPPRLLDRPASGSYRISSHPIIGARSLTLPDLATALLDTLNRADLYRKALYVAS